ncbi:uncharacterized protein LOC134753187 [Cydia strobilella]|uniref:uncharacterized protein LOC134753187 n=1 Tax=Cydia strobilella TaxID=1100964 RepID=UPI0030049D27
MQVRCIALLAFAHAALGSIFPVPNHLNDVNAATTTGTTNNTIITKSTMVARRANPRMKARRSTSSSSGDRLIGKSKSSGDSLGLESSGESSSEEKQRKPLEGGGWRKWHRKCTPCPEDMAKKWRDPTIKWICSGYQRARRSFKSECMMYYRNCQDGTMFTKIHDHRCDETAAGYTGGRHFFYDYKVKLPEDTSGKSTETETSSFDSSDSSARRSDSGDG